MSVIKKRSVSDCPLPKEKKGAQRRPLPKVKKGLIPVILFSLSVVCVALSFMLAGKTMIYVYGGYSIISAVLFIVTYIRAMICGIRAYIAFVKKKARVSERPFPMEKREYKSFLKKCGRLLLTSIGLVFIYGLTTFILKTGG